MLSPAERAIRITLSGPNSRISAMVMIRRPTFHLDVYRHVGEVRDLFEGGHAFDDFT